VKATRVVKLKFSGSKKADEILPLWLKCANWLSKIAFVTKETNSNRLAQAYYAELRKQGLPSQLACSLCRTVSATYKSAKSRGKWKLAHYKKPVIPIVWKRDFNRTQKGISLWSEILTIHDSRELPDSKWMDSKIKKTGKDWVLFLFYQIEIPEPNTNGCIVGCDFGLKRMLVASNSSNSKPFFFHGGELNHRRSCIRRTRSAIQSVGSKSARRLLKRISGNEAAVTAHLLHVASKALVGYAVEVGARRIVVENLKNIRDASLRKGKELRSKIHRWPYADMKFKIQYKAAAVGIDLEVVSPVNTSRACPRCGHVSALNRNGLDFCCKKCGHRGDADLNASRNILARSVSIACNAAGTGSFKAPESIESCDIDSESCVPHGDLVSMEDSAKI
jgi:putative transposase